MYLHTIIVKLLLSICYIKIVMTKMHWFWNKFAISISWCCKKYVFYSTLYWGNVKWWYWYIQGLQTWCKYREYNDCIWHFFPVATKSSLHEEGYSWLHRTPMQASCHPTWSQEEPQITYMHNTPTCIHNMPTCNMHVQHANMQAQYDMSTCRHNMPTCHMHQPQMCTSSMPTCDMQCNMHPWSAKHSASLHPPTYVPLRMCI